MSSPVDLALTAYAPVPPPPISASGNKPFQRSAVVVSAVGEPSTKPSLTATSRSTRDTPSPSRISLNDSVDGFGTQAPSLQLSAPYSPSLEVTVQPPPMPRVGGPSYSLTQSGYIAVTCGGNVVNGCGFSTLGSSPRLTAVGERETPLSCGALRLQKHQNGSNGNTIPATTPHRSGHGVPPLTFSTSPPTLHRGTAARLVKVKVSEERPGGVAQALSHEHHNSNNNDNGFLRCDSLPTTHDTANDAGTATGGTTATTKAKQSTAVVMTDAPSLSPVRGENCFNVKSTFATSASPVSPAPINESTAWSKASTSLERPRNDPQPALPQRPYQTSLALFVDYVAPPCSNMGCYCSPMLHTMDFCESGCGALSSSFGLSHAMSSTEFSLSSGGVANNAVGVRTWGCVRGTQLNFSSMSSSDPCGRSVTPVLCDAVTVGDMERPASASRTALAPPPLFTPPSLSSNGCANTNPHATGCDQERLSVDDSCAGTVNATGNTPKGHVCHAAPNGCVQLDSEGRQLRRHPVRVTCPSHGTCSALCCCCSNSPCIARAESAVFVRYEAVSPPQGCCKRDGDGAVGVCHKADVRIEEARCKGS